MKKMHCFLIRIAVVTFLVFVFASLAQGAEKIVSGTLNINTASAEELRLLRGVGKKTAAKIISSREKKPFEVPEELLSRKLVSKRIFKDIAGFLAVSGSSDYKTNAGAKAKKTSSSGAKDQDTLRRFFGEIYWLPDKHFYSELMEKIENARHSILLTSFVFKISSSPKNLAGKLVNALGQARQRGVQIEVVLEKSSGNLSLNNDNLQSAKKLQELGVPVRFDDPDKTLHSKTAVIDRRWVFIGSHNLTHSALFFNKEATLMVDSIELATTVADYATGIR